MTTTIPTEVRKAHRLNCDGPVLIRGAKQERPWSCSCGEWQASGYDAPVRAAHREHLREMAASQPE